MLRETLFIRVVVLYCTRVTNDAARRGCRIATADISGEIGGTSHDPIVASTNARVGDAEAIRPSQHSRAGSPSRQDETTEPSSVALLSSLWADSIKRIFIVVCMAVQVCALRAPAERGVVLHLGLSHVTMHRTFTCCYPLGHVGCSSSCQCTSTVRVFD